MKKLLVALAFIGLNTLSNAQNPEQHRPQFHFSPREHWMNDPNGMFYLNGTYHLYFQYYPDANVWGPMHWGHATSKDLISWTEQKIALYPDSLGYIFSGSAVVDHKNTSGFGKNGKTPIVAIFTHHEPVGEQQGSKVFQNQSIAYSLDEGYTWTKYEGNPVVKNPGIRDFRDPKVSWIEAANKWIMTLAVADRIFFYSSPNLKDWTKESEFGETAGRHGGVWECPDLYTLNHNGKKYWILNVSISENSPNGGTGTQYFIGDFDGHKFTPMDNETRWFDYGSDDYAAVTFNNTGDRRIQMGWMSNWAYGTRVPTEKWRSAMTIARELNLVSNGSKLYVASAPIFEFEKNFKRSLNTAKPIQLLGSKDLSDQLAKSNGLYQLDFSFEQKEDFEIQLSNDKGEILKIGFKKDSSLYYIDRTQAGKSNFGSSFAKRHISPQITKSTLPNQTDRITLIVDHSSVEFFAGLNVMTDLIFPTENYNHCKIVGPEKAILAYCNFSPIKPGVMKKVQ